MKLSDVKGERVFDVIADITDPVLNIAEDEDARSIFTRESLPVGMSMEQFFIKKIRRSVPKICRNFKSDVITILSSISGVSKEKYLENLDLLVLGRDFTELLTDKAFLSFFTSAQTGGNSSGDAPENTEGHIAQ